MSGTREPPAAPLAGRADLMPELYAELRRLARSRLAAGGRNVLLDTTVWRYSMSVQNYRILLCRTCRTPSIS